MNLQELSIKLYTLNIKHTYKADKEIDKLYLNDEKYTIILNTNKDNSIFLKVWKKWNTETPIEKQEQKHINACRLVKYHLLKKLHTINKTDCNNQLILEPIPTSAEETNLYKNENDKNLLDR
jgi:hypothetical protein